MEVCQGQDGASEQLGGERWGRGLGLAAVLGRRYLARCLRLEKTVYCMLFDLQVVF